jgi:hypothetical protein
MRAGPEEPALSEPGAAASPVAWTRWRQGKSSVGSWPQSEYGGAVVLLRHLADPTWLVLVAGLRSRHWLEGEPVEAVT